VTEECACNRLGMDRRWGQDRQSMYLQRYGEINRVDDLAINNLEAGDN
jgi:hypothetical protein